MSKHQPKRTEYRAERGQRRALAARERLGWRQAEQQMREHRDPKMRVTLPRVRWLEARGAEAKPCER